MAYLYGVLQDIAFCGFSINKGEKTMTNSMERTILECGFRPPNLEYVKNDPRGREYGYFQVVVSSAAASTDPTIHVCKRKRTGILEWSCKFDDLFSFAAWAKDNT